MIMSSLSKDARIVLILRREHLFDSETRASRLYVVMLRGLFKVG
jgi:hypothetical protein